MTKYLKVRAPYSDQCFSYTPNNFFPEQSYYHFSWPNIYAPSGLHPLRPWLWCLQGSDWGWRLRCCFLAWRRCNSQSRCHRRKPSWGCPLFGYARLSSLVEVRLVQKVSLHRFLYLGPRVFRGETWYIETKTLDIQRSIQDVCEDAITIKQTSGTSRINYGGVSINLVLYVVSDLYMNRPRYASDYMSFVELF